MESQLNQLKSIINTIRKGHYAEALQELSKAGFGNEKGAENLHTPKLVLHEAVACFEKGQFEAAYQKVLHIYDELLAEAPFVLDSSVVDILLIVKDTERAQRYIEHHLAFNTPDTDKLYLKALVWFRQKNYVRAREAMEQACRLGPLQAEQYMLLSQCHQFCGGYDHAMRAAESAWEQGAPRADMQMIRLIFTRKGTCNSCNGMATCCVNLQLFDQSSAIRSKLQLDSFLISDPRLKVWQHTGHDADGNWLFNCSVLSPNGRCSRHQTRPQVCRDFPIDPVSVSAYPYCSYRFETRKAAPHFSLPAAFDAVSRKLMAFGCRKEWDALKKHQ